MEKEANFQRPTRGAHVLVLTYPMQGHVNPMLQFSKRLASKGLKVTLVTSNTLQFSTQTTNYLPNLDFVTISDGFNDQDKQEDIEAYMKRLRTQMCQSLPKLFDHYKQNNTSLNPTLKMVVYDAVMPWVLDLVRKFGLKGAPFFTQSCLVNSIYYHAYQGALKLPPLKGSLVSIPSIMELLRADDLPSFVSSPSIYPAVVRLAFEQLSNPKEPDFLFVNTVDKLESKVLHWMTTQWSVKTIGPAIPSMYLDKRLQDDTDYGVSMFKPETNTCMQWLDEKEAGSVVYISMGSMASLGEEQMKEIALGLEQCSKYFLWVVRASEENKLPLNFKDKTSKKGLIVNWCPQLEILAHRALGCFMTHCGWNSTLEAISLGVPMVAFPQWTDQPTNAKCITDFWRIGIRVKGNEQGIVTRKEIESCIREVMEGERAKEIKSNATKWKQIAKEAMEEGGSSDRNIEEFVAKLLSS